LVAAAAGVCGGSLGAVAALGQVITDAVAKMVMDLAESSATLPGFARYVRSRFVSGVSIVLPWTVN